MFLVVEAEYQKIKRDPETGFHQDLRELKGLPVVMKEEAGITAERFEKVAGQFRVEEMRIPFRLFARPVEPARAQGDTFPGMGVRLFGESAVPLFREKRNRPGYPVRNER